MRVYLDTSAVLPLVLPEERSAVMGQSWPDFKERWAWSWLVVEGEAALIRQRADSAAWSAWHQVIRSLNLVEMESAAHGALRAFNRGLG